VSVTQWSERRRRERAFLRFRVGLERRSDVFVFPERSEEKGKNREPGSRKFSVRKIICDRFPPPPQRTK